jgi:glycerophosphoryl diester phosphodiesterase
MRVVGHRGVRPVPGDGRGELPPENTLAAFARAVAEGADAIEFDVRLCKSGEAVVFHDPDLARMGGDDRAVADVPLSGLPLVRGEKIPTLAEALELCAQLDVTANVEIKYDFVDRRALAWAAARIARASKAEVIASSFDPRVLAWFASRAPRVRRAWLVNVTQRQIARSIRAFARRGALHAVHLERRLANPDRIRLLHARGLRVGVWTVNDPREALDLFDVGADWIVTDWPAAMV